MAEVNIDDNGLYRHPDIVAMRDFHEEEPLEILASRHDIDYIKLETRHLHRAVNEDAMRTYAAGLVSLVHGLGLVVLAQGVDQEEELAALWELGFDGAAGAALEGSNPPGG